MTLKDTFPPLDRPTVEVALDLAPDRCPNPKEDEREIWMKAGERRLAVRLLSLLENQENQDRVQLHT